MTHAGSMPVPGWAGSMDEFRTLVQRRLGGRVHDLQLEFSPDRCLILLGRTDTYYAKQLAQQIALETLGAEIAVSNEIVVC